jgi:hypothetical protein
MIAPDFKNGGVYKEINEYDQKISNQNSDIPF